MTDHAKPTPQGLLRYSHSAGYYLGLADPSTGKDLMLACTCSPECKPRCAGECGCSACEMQFAEFCDEAGIYSPDGTEVNDDEALRRYRAL